MNFLPRIFELARIACAKKLRTLQNDKNLYHDIPENNFRQDPSSCRTKKELEYNLFKDHEKLFKVSQSFYSMYKAMTSISE